MINKAVSYHKSQMKTTLVINAEQAVKNYRDNMMEYLYSIINDDDVAVEDFAVDLVQLGRDIRELLNPDANIALAKFRDEFRTGSTMTILNPEEFEQLEAWDKNKEDFQIAIFREDGTAVGIVDQAHINW